MRLAIDIAWLHTEKHTRCLPKIVADKPLRPQIMPPVLKPHECVEWHNEPSSIDLVSLEVHNRIIVMRFPIVHEKLTPSSENRRCIMNVDISLSIHGMTSSLTTHLPAKISLNRSIGGASTLTGFP